MTQRITQRGKKPARKRDRQKGEVRVTFVGPPPDAVSRTQDPMTHLLTALTAQLQQQTVVLQQVLSAVREGNSPSRADTEVSPSSSPKTGISTQTTSQCTTVGSASPAQAVTLLAPQIPEFTGTEEDNVQIWVQRVTKVAQIHGAPDDVTFLAASSKLTKTARRWFDLSTGQMIESWESFKQAIVKRFDRKILFHVAIQRIETRKWNYTKETFLEYSMDKLVLMHSLNLP